jgi:hypothetical protein
MFTPWKARIGCTTTRLRLRISALISAEIGGPGAENGSLTRINRAFGAEFRA